MDTPNPAASAELTDADLKISSEMSADTAMYLAIGATFAFLLIAWPISPWLAVPTLGLAYRQLDPDHKWHSAALYSSLMAGIGASLQLIKTVMPLGILCVVAFAVAIVLHSSASKKGDERGALRAVRDTAVWVGLGLLLVCGAVIAADIAGLHPEYRPSVGTVADLLVSGRDWLYGTLGIGTWIALAGMAAAAALALVLRSRGSANPGAAHIAGLLAAVCAFGFAVNERGDRYRDARAEYAAKLARIERNRRMAETEEAQKKARFAVQQLHHSRKLLVNYAYLHRRVAVLSDEVKGDLYAFLLETSTHQYGSEARQRLARKWAGKLPKFEIDTAPDPSAAPIEPGIARVNAWTALELDTAIDTDRPADDLAAIDTETERIRGLYRSTRTAVAERFLADVWAARALQMPSAEGPDGAPAAGEPADGAGKSAPPARPKPADKPKALTPEEADMEAQMAELEALEIERERKRLERSMEYFTGDLMEAFFPWPSSLEGSAPVHDVASAAAWAEERVDPETWVWSLRRTPADLEAHHSAVAMSYLTHVASLESQREAKRKAEIEEAAAAARERARVKRELELLYGAPVQEDGAGGYYIRGSMGRSRSSGGSYRGGGGFGIRRRRRRTERPERLSA